MNKKIFFLNSIFSALFICIGVLGSDNCLPQKINISKVVDGTMLCLNNCTRLSGGNFTCNAVSVSPNGLSKAIYCITINGISVAALNLSGLNGFNYTISITDSSGNTTTKHAFPLGGMMAYNYAQYYTLRPVTFNIEGPLYDGTGQAPKITLTCSAFDMNHSGTEVTLLTETQDIPKYTCASLNFDSYTIRILTNRVDKSIWNYDNGTCAVPIDVRIFDSQGDPVTDQSIYNHLVFAYNSNTGNDPYKIIEGDPTNTDEYCAMLTASSIEYQTSDSSKRKLTDTITRHVKYGLDGAQLSSIKGGQVYYIFTEGKTLDGSFIHVGLVNDSGSFSTGSVNVPVHIYSPRTGNSLKTQEQTDNGFIYKLILWGDFTQAPNIDANGNQQFMASNEYALYNSSVNPGVILPNYIFSDDYANTMSIYFVPNEVLSTQAMIQRYNWTNLGTGYNIETVDSQGIPQENPLNTDVYEWQKCVWNLINEQMQNMTDLCSATQEQDLYDYLFDQYGLVHFYTPAPDSLKNVFYNFNNGTFKLPNNFSVAPVYFTTNAQVESSQYGLPSSNFGLFIGSNTNLTIYTNNDESGNTIPTTNIPDMNTDINKNSILFWPDMQIQSIKNDYKKEVK